MTTDFAAISIQEEWLPTLEHITDQLVEKGYALVDNLLPEELVNAIKHRLLELHDEDEFHKSGIGKNILHQVNTDIRGDYIRWIETDDLPPTVEPYYDFLNQLVHFINRQLFVGLKDYESHYTYYPKGKYYLKHRDRFRKNPHRVISIVFYLNEEWDKNDGGELVIYDDEQQALTTILPKWNRLAIFKSEMIHEVLECHRPRYSITTWVLDKEKELTFL